MAYLTNYEELHQQALEVLVAGYQTPVIVSPRMKQQMDELLEKLVREDVIAALTAEVRGLEELTSSQAGYIEQLNRELEQRHKDNAWLVRKIRELEEEQG